MHTLQAWFEVYLPNNLPLRLKTMLLCIYSLSFYLTVKGYARLSLDAKWLTLSLLTLLSLQRDGTFEGIGATEGVDWRAGPVKRAAMGFKIFIIKQPQNHN